MPNLFKSGLAWQTEQFVAHASESVTIKRGAAEKTDVPAMLGSKLLKLSDEFGVRMEHTDMDFFIPAASYDFGDGPVTPERGDVVELTVGAETQRFEVFPFGGGSDDMWRWSDPVGQTMLRIHTKRIGAVG